MEKAEELWQKFDDVQSEIKVIEEQYGNQRSEFEKLYYKTVGKGREFVKREEEANNSSNISNITTFDRPITNISIKLPTLNLQAFDGNYSQWLEFRYAFVAVIYSNSNYEI